MHGEEQAPDPELRSKEEFAWCPKGNEARKAFRKVLKAIGKVGFRTSPPGKGSSNDFNPHKGRGKDQKGKGKEGGYPQSGLSASETASEEGHDHSWEPDDWFSSFTDDPSCARYGTGHTAWMASVLLNLAHQHVVLDLGCTRSIGPRAAISRIQMYALYHGIATEFCPCTHNAETETCWESCII